PVPDVHGSRTVVHHCEDRGEVAALAEGGLEVVVCVVDNGVEIVDGSNLLGGPDAEVVTGHLSTAGHDHGGGEVRIGCPERRTIRSSFNYDVVVDEFSGFIEAQRVVGNPGNHPSVEVADHSSVEPRSVRIEPVVRIDDGCAIRGRLELGRNAGTE